MTVVLQLKICHSEVNCWELSCGPAALMCSLCNVMFIYIAQKFIIIPMRFTQAKLDNLKMSLKGPFLNDVSEFADFSSRERAFII